MRRFFKKESKKSLIDFSDKELIRLIVDSGQDKYKKELYNRYTNKVYGKCILLTKDKEISKDLTHDIFIKVFMNIDKFREESDFSFWIHSITYNHCMSFFKKNKHIDEISEGVEYDLTEDNDREEDAFEIKNYRMDLLEIAFTELKEKERLILLMYYKDGFSVKKIAEHLSIGESAVKMRMKRARQQLHDLIISKENDL